MNLHKTIHENKHKVDQKRSLLVAVGVVVVVGIILLLFLSEHTSQNSMSDMHNITIQNEEQFLIEMIAHHQEAVDTSKIILAATKNSGVSRVAETIIGSQESEIKQMSEWKKQWYGYSWYKPQYKMMMPDLSSYSGLDKEDKTYLYAMMEHHRMGISMAQQVLTLKPHPQVAELANNIIASQTTEVAFMGRIYDN